MNTWATDRRHGNNVSSVGWKIPKRRIKKERNEEGCCKAFWVNVNAMNVTYWEVKLKTNIY